MYEEPQFRRSVHASSKARRDYQKEPADVILFISQTKRLEGAIVPALGLSACYFGGQWWLEVGERVLTDRGLPHLCGPTMRDMIVAKAF